MKKGSFNFKKQIDGYGLYAEIDLECEMTDTRNGVEITFEEKPAYWKTAILFGCTYFLEHCEGHKGLLVTVKRIKWRAVDTTGGVVVYVTVNALKEALGTFLTREPEFNEDLKTFIVPE
jgi:hypothetical protein